MLLFATLITATLVHFISCQPNYCQPCSACWPSDDTIQNFNQSLVGFVIQPKEVEKFQHASVVYNYRLYQFPGLIVEPNNAGDVQKALEFAQNYSIQVSIKSSGHCFVGRSSLFGSLNINLRNLQAIQVNLNDSTSETGASVTVETGANWLEVYSEVDRYGRVVNGGSSPTVAVGGYTTGGGHGPMSRSIGLGVDNAIGFQIVTADRQIRNCTVIGCLILKDNGQVEQDPNGADLFWAVRGGGGSFGVVTSFTFKIYVPPPQFVRLIISWPIIHEFYGEVGERMMNFYNEFVKTMSSKWGGYMLVNNIGPVDTGTFTYTGSITLALLHYGPYDEAYSSIAPLLEVEKEAQLTNFFQNFTTFYDYTLTVDDYAPARLYLIDRFIQPQDLNANFTKLLTSDIFLTGVQGIGVTIIHIGGKVSEPDLSTSSVAEGFRSGIYVANGAIGWQSEYLDDVNMAALKNFSHYFYKFGKNMYYNEPDQDVVDWKNEFWFPNYDRLLQIKQIYDPQHVFTCKKCVGWDLLFKDAGTADGIKRPYTIYQPYGRF